MPVQIVYRVCPLKHIVSEDPWDSLIWQFARSLEYFHAVMRRMSLAMPLGEAYFYPGDPWEVLVKIQVA